MTKHELRRYRWLAQSNAALLARLDVLRAKAERTTHAPSLAPGHGPESWEDVVAEMADIADVLHQRVLEELALMRRIDAAVRSLPDRERAVIEARYIDGKRWEQIALEFNYSWQHLHKIHAAALRFLSEK
ncbi:MAG: hypothetical protein LBS45_12330 [Synergistaceae bacterium]|jgi:RNA polymerase sigma factor (sigma-70 family)|nr:hypothetical protein [Synergistaceae bacterium]